ncbi:hypothetical protein [Litorimonas sp.]|uniref:hypothetical protein n=1 Tax=Litorimonas sp. TaxID=1892381 RepID=UPI003A8A7179
MTHYDLTHNDLEAWNAYSSKTRVYHDEAEAQMVCFLEGRRSQKQEIEGLREVIQEAWNIVEGFSYGEEVQPSMDWLQNRLRANLDKEQSQ